MSHVYKRLFFYVNIYICPKTILPDPRQEEERFASGLKFLIAFSFLLLINSIFIGW